MGKMILGASAFVGASLLSISAWGASLPPVSWPATSDLVISNGTSAPAGLSPVNGNCVIGSGGTWTAGNCNGSISNIYAVTLYGAVADERFVSDGVITAGSSSLTSASAAFTSADTGKTITVGMGAQGIVSGTYTSGATSVTGASGTICTLSSFNGSGSGATAVVPLSSANTISSSTALVFTAEGSGYSGVTTATLGNGTNRNGTATCSGTVTVSISSYYAHPVTTTMTYVNATTATLGTTATTSVTGANVAVGTDNTTAVQAAINAASSAGGGTVYFPASLLAYLINGQITIPTVTVNTYVKTRPITLLGEGGGWTNLSTTNQIPATRVDMRYSGAAKISTTGSGYLAVKRIGFEDNGYDSTPFILTTNTTLYAQDNSFTGSGPGAAMSVNDAVWTGTASVGFQGYGTQIDHNYFDKINRGLYGQYWSNAIVLSNNSWSYNCGGFAAFEFDGTVDQAQYNSYYGNLIETVHYQHTAYFLNSRGNEGASNTEWDQGQLYTSGMYLSGASQGNVCLGCSFATPYVDATGGNIPLLIYQGTSSQNYQPQVSGIQNLSTTGNVTAAGTVAATGTISSTTQIKLIDPATNNLLFGVESDVLGAMFLGNSATTSKINMQGTTANITATQATSLVFTLTGSSKNFSFGQYGDINFGTGFSLVNTAAGNLRIAGQGSNAVHTNYYGTAPTIGTGCGTGAALGQSGDANRNWTNDSVGRITLGTSPGASCSITFALTWTDGAPVCHVENETSDNHLRSTPSTTALVMTGTLTASDVLSWSCRGYGT